MIVTRINVVNWRNFRKLDVQLQSRQFLVGPNASGKSNFLDIFRFLRDVVDVGGGGLQKAVRQRGGLTRIRSLAARKDPQVLIDVSLGRSSSASAQWRYYLSIEQETRGLRQVLVKEEKVWKNGTKILERPNEDDKKDTARLSQTFLEQVNTNRSFREIASFFQKITYLHLVPQLLRNADIALASVLENDPFGQSFLERIAKTPEATRRKRLAKIEDALKIAVPQLKQLEFVRDESSGRPHLQVLYDHWRPNAGKQREDQFSDGTLRFIGLFWSLLESSDLLLLEEPELSLNDGIVKFLAPLIGRMQRNQDRQILISTHSEALLTDTGISGDELLMFEPAREGTSVSVASGKKGIRELLDSGFTAAQAVLTQVEPRNITRLSAFNNG